MKLNKKLTNWLHRNSATPTEIEIYEIMKRIYQGKPLMNGDIAKHHETHRTNVLNHLNNMVRKGIVKKHRDRYYIPIQP